MSEIDLAGEGEGASSPLSPPTSTTPLPLPSTSPLASFVTDTANRAATPEGEVFAPEAKAEAGTESLLMELVGKDEGGIAEGKLEGGENGDLGKMGNGESLVPSWAWFGVWAERRRGGEPSMDGECIGVV